MTDWPAGLGREACAELDSTNAEALRRAARGETGPVWIFAETQTAARGRRNRPWRSPPGSFAASLLMRPGGSPAEAALRSFTAALGLFDALSEITGRPEIFALKWPNDVLLDGAKVAGILLETGAGGALTIGIGVNLGDAPRPDEIEPGAVAPAGLAAATGVAIAPERFLDHLGPGIWAWETVLVREGFGPVREAWLARAARLGGQVTARLPGREISGRLATIDASGACVIETAAGRVSLPAAELHFPPDGMRETADAARD